MIGHAAPRGRVALAALRPPGARLYWRPRRRRVRPARSGAERNGGTNWVPRGALGRIRAACPVARVGRASPSAHPVGRQPTVDPSQRALAPSSAVAIAAVPRPPVWSALPVAAPTSPPRPPVPLRWPPHAVEEVAAPRGPFGSTAGSRAAGAPPWPSAPSSFTRRPAQSPFPPTAARRRLRRPPSPRRATPQRGGGDGRAADRRGGDPPAPAASGSPPRRPAAWCGHR
jgi:hypothetical protein